MYAAAKLILGWRLDRKGRPREWARNVPDLTSPEPAGTVYVSADAMCTGTAIIAQSGAGKSFFIGRLVEEIVLRTKARCFAFDPNGDFRDIDQVVSDDRWSTARYDHSIDGGWLPTEPRRGDFAAAWERVSKSVHSVGMLEPRSTRNQMNIVVPWKDIPSELLCAIAEGMNTFEAFLCHKSIELVQTLLANMGIPVRTGSDILAMAEKILMAENEDQLIRDLGLHEFQAAAPVTSLAFFPDALKREFLRSKEFLSLRRLRRLVSMTVARLYFSAACSLVDSGLFSLDRGDIQDDSRLRILDLASIRDRSFRLAVASAFLADLWRNAQEGWNQAMRGQPDSDMRVPVFVIVDEAHHLIPRRPESALERKLTEQFRRIAAEGRKLGVFLVIVSQRPERIDELVLGECANVAVLRKNTSFDLTQLPHLPGLVARVARKLTADVSLRAGRVAVIGGWAPDGPTLLYTAARRTTEGGRNLRDEHWAVV